VGGPPWKEKGESETTLFLSRLFCSLTLSICRFLACSLARLFAIAFSASSSLLLARSLAFHTPTHYLERRATHAHPHRSMQLIVEPQAFLHPKECAGICWKEESKSEAHGLISLPFLSLWLSLPFCCLPFLSLPRSFGC